MLKNALDDRSLTGDGNVTSNVKQLQISVFSLFFIFGGITSLNDVLIPKLKDLFTLSFFEAMLIQSAFFAAYFVISLPAAALVQRVGYLKAATFGLMTMMAGCLLFIPASQSGMFALFLLALFILASGVTIVQVVVNPLISLLGPAASAHSRLTFAQAFNSLGTTVFPYFGALLILGSLATVDTTTLSGVALDAYRAAETSMIVKTYLGLAAALVAVAALVWSRRRLLLPSSREAVPSLGAFSLFKRPRFALGTSCIFLYVGAEVAIGSIIVSYLVRPEVMALSLKDAGQMVPLYWGGALIGRFIGAAVLRVVSPGLVLAFAGACAVALLALSANGAGSVSGWALLAIGLANSIMFPTIFSLASEGLGPRAAEGSGLICMAIVGGAFVPPLTGVVADLTSLPVALGVPALCYVLIAGYGLFTARARSRTAGV